MQKLKLNKSILAAAIGSAAALGVAMGNAAHAAEEGIEEISITGSRIRRTDIESNKPVTVVDRRAILDMGYTDMGDMLQRMPSMSGSPLGTTTNNGGDGSVRIDLRGLGSNRTLNLVNGKRTVDGGDFQTIPGIMIEKVDILKDGGSAVYGADAVSGVVNILTRQNFEGFEAQLYTADFNNMKSGKQDSYSFIVGKNFDSGNIIFGGELVQQQDAYQSDAPWEFFKDSWYIYPGGCERQLTAPYDGTPNGGCFPQGSSRIPEGRLRFASQGTFMNEGKGLTPFDGRTYNYAPVNYIQTPYDKTNVFGQANFDLSDITLRTEMRYNNRTSAQELAAQPYNSPTDPAYKGVFNGRAYSGISPDNYYLRRAIDAYNTSNGGSLAYEPVVDARRRMLETPRRFTQNVEQLQLNAALSGDIGSVSWDAYYNRGWRSSRDTDYGQFSGTRLANAMGPSADLDGDGTPECYKDINTASSKIQGCVPFNFFGGPMSVTDDMLKYVGVVLNDSNSFDQEQYGFSFSGNAFELPAGQIGWAAGYERRNESAKVTPDSNKVIGEVTGNKGAGTNGKYSVDSFFAEALLPVYDNGTQKLEFNLGVRSDDFSTFGRNSVYQTSFRFDLMKDLVLRGSYGESFRAPDIFDLYQGIIDSFPTYKDPCIPPAGETLPAGCAKLGVQLDSQVLSRIGGNKDLQPEEGDNTTLGLVWTPSFAFGDISLTIDYWQNELSNGISSLGVNYILNDCYREQNASSCALVSRRDDYSIAYIQDAPLNVALLRVAGIDTEARWSLQNELGEWSASFLWSHQKEQERQAFPGDDVVDLAGTYLGTAYADDKINYTLSWGKGNFRVSYLGEYISELQSEDAFGLEYEYTIDSQLYHDIVLNYDIEKYGLSMALGITNLTDEAPPYIDLGFNAKTDPGTYRLFGQGYYLRVGYAF